MIYCSFFDDRTCVFCPPGGRRIIGADPDQVHFRLLEHMERHENIHHGDEDVLESGVRFGCRACPDRTWRSGADLEDHIDRKHRNLGKGRTFF